MSNTPGKILRLPVAACALLAALVAPLSAVPVDPALPAYQPLPVVPPAGAGYVARDGTIQIVGFDDMQGVIESLNTRFVASHPNFKFTYRAGGSGSAAAALTFGASPFAPMGAEFTASALYGHNKLLNAEPLAVRIAHSSLNPAAKLGAVAVIVHPGNPLDTLTTGQVTRLFAIGAPKGDFTHWNQAGVKGELAGREIRPCGLPESDYYGPSDDPSFGAFMVLRKMDGAHFSPNYEALPAAADIVRRVSEDPAAVGLVALNRVTPAVKVVALRTNAWSAPSRGSAEDLVAGQYPYERYLYLCVRLVPGEPFDPFVKEYLRLVLSREGQAAIAAETHGYLPLNAGELAQERAKID